jgi:hypothetical protein
MKRETAQYLADLVTDVCCTCDGPTIDGGDLQCVHIKQSVMTGCLLRGHSGVYRGERWFGDPGRRKSDYRHFLGNNQPGERMTYEELCETLRGNR